jgi:hypothetical protein
MPPGNALQHLVAMVLVYPQERRLGRQCQDVSRQRVRAISVQSTRCPDRRADGVEEEEANQQPATHGDKI